MRNSTRASVWEGARASSDTENRRGRVGVGRRLVNRRSWERLNRAIEDELRLGQSAYCCGVESWIGGRCGLHCREAEEE